MSLRLTKEEFYHRLLVERGALFKAAVKSDVNRWTPGIQSKSGQTAFLDPDLFAELVTKLLSDAIDLVYDESFPCGKISNAISLGS